MTEPATRLAALAFLLGLVPLLTARAGDIHATLSLSAIGSVSAAPDTLGATLHAAATATSPAAASASINRLVSSARHSAAAFPSVAFAAGAYEVAQDAAPDTRWQATQSINISAKDADALLSLLAALQRQNLVTDDLSWQLSDRAAEALRQQATEIALQSLQDDAAADARVLGMRVDHFVTVNVDSDPGIARPKAMMARAAVTGPSIDRPDDARIGVTVHADVSLTR